MSLTSSQNLFRATAIAIFTKLALFFALSKNIRHFLLQNQTFLRTEEFKRNRDGYTEPQRIRYRKLMD